MGPKKQEPESLESPKGKETASELADEANETGSGNAIPSSEGGAASSGASVEARTTGPTCSTGFSMKFRCYFCLPSYCWSTSALHWVTEPAGVRRTAQPAIIAANKSKIGKP